MNYEVEVTVKLKITGVENRNEALKLARRWEGETDSISGLGSIYWNCKISKINSCKQLPKTEELVSTDDDNDSDWNRTWKW